MQKGTGRGGGQRWAWTHKYAVPMFVTSLIAVILSGSGLLAVAVFANGGGHGDAASGIDPCVVGTWRTVGHSETIPTINVPVELASGRADFVFNPDGTGSADYGEGMTLAGENTLVEFFGRVTFEYEAANGRFRYLSEESEATLTLTASGIPLSQELTFSRRPAQYQCEGDILRFTQAERSYQSESQRVGS